MVLNESRKVGKIVRGPVVAFAAFVLTVHVSAILFNVPPTGHRLFSLITPVTASVDTTQRSVRIINDDVLWLARCILSESDRDEEQVYAAWVVRNRVETSYRGRDTYEGVVLDPYQFSAFNRGSHKRSEFMSLTAESTRPGWDSALEVAMRVYSASDTTRPFDRDTRHFYSRQSMRGRRVPGWARGRRAVSIQGIDTNRFLFFSGIQ